MQSTLQSSERVLPDEETVMNIVAAAGWEYRPMYFKGELFQHRLTTAEGREYMVPITAGVPAHIEVWNYFKQLNHK